MNRTFAALLLLSTAAGAQAGAGDPEVGKTKSVPCQACHGVDGNSSNPEWPKLAGQHAGYLAQQLAAFKSGARQNATMSAMVAGLSEQDMHDLAAYYASQMVQIGGAQERMVAPGEKVFKGGNQVTGVPACMGCHGPSGAGNTGAGFPALAGQHAAYTAKALKDYKSGARNNVIMQGVATKMGDDEIAAVADYLSGLH